MKKLLSLLFCLLILCSKSNNEAQPEPKNAYVPTVIPDDITKLYASRGDQTSDTVWVFLQGGPDFKNNFELEAENTDGKSYDFFDDDLRVYPYQVQHINKEMKTFDDFTYEDAQKET